jgi:hypothetical protein
MMSLVYLGICIQAGVDHDAVDEIINYAGDAVNTAQPIVKTRQALCGHRSLPLTSTSTAASVGRLRKIMALVASFLLGPHSWCKALLKQPVQAIAKQIIHFINRVAALCRKDIALR